MITLIRPHDINLFTIYISFKVQNYSHSNYLLLAHDSVFEFLIIIGDLYISIFHLQISVILYVIKDIL